MVDQIIRPADLPNRASPNASEKIPVDNGSSVAGATVESIVLAGRPTASQAEAEAGIDAVKAMTPLTTKQAIDAQVPGKITDAIADLNLGSAAQSETTDFATSAQGLLADSAVQSIGEGSDISVDVTDPQNPVVSYVGAGVSDGDKGDVIVSDSGAKWELARYRKTVALLIADTVFSYTAGSGKTLVSIGDIVTAQGFRYEVAASGATDAHIETAGGVKLYVLHEEMGFHADAFGAGSGAADVSADMQKALDRKAAIISDETYLVGSPLRLPPLTKLSGIRPTTGFIGSTATFQGGIKKTTNTTVTITPFEGAPSVQDCILYLDPAWPGDFYPQKLQIEGLSLQGRSDGNGRVDKAIYIEQGGGFVFRNLDISRAQYAIYAKDAWLTHMDSVHAVSSFAVLAGTSWTFDNCWTGAGPGSHGGYYFTTLSYSTMNSCASDGATNSAYFFYNCKMTLNSCGCEGAVTQEENVGTAIQFAGDNKIVLNSFVVVPKEDQTDPYYSFGANENITFQKGETFSHLAQDAPDIRVNGNNSCIVFDEYTFVNGTRNQPRIEFAVGVVNSKVFVKFDGNERIYTTDGAGNTLIEAFRDSGSFTPKLTVDGSESGITYASQTGKWKKQGNVISVSGQVVLTSKGAGTGPIRMQGWPDFGPGLDGAASLLITGSGGANFLPVINGATPTSMVIYKNGTDVGDATAADLSHSSTIRFAFSYQKDT